MAKKFVYKFTEGDGTMRELLGGKGANLAEMAGLGLPVPMGFTITTEACTRYYADGEKIADEIVEQIMEKVEMLENASGKKFGDPKNPLLVSVRSGARISMPGMMDTVLNLGINDEIAEGLATLSLILISPASKTSFAIVLLFITRDSFKYLSILIAYSPLL